MVSFKNTLISLAMLVALSQAIALPVAKEEVKVSLVARLYPPHTYIPIQPKGLTADQKLDKTARIDDRTARDANKIAGAQTREANRAPKEAKNKAAQQADREKIKKEKAEMAKLQKEMSGNQADLTTQKTRGGAMQSRDKADKATVTAATADEKLQAGRLARVNAAKVIS